LLKFLHKLRFSRRFDSSHEAIKRIRQIDSVSEWVDENDRLAKLLTTSLAEVGETSTQMVHLAKVQIALIQHELPDEISDREFTILRKSLRHSSKVWQKLDSQDSVVISVSTELYSAIGELEESFKQSITDEFNELEGALSSTHDLQSLGDIARKLVHLKSHRNLFPDLFNNQIADADAETVNRYKAIAAKEFTKASSTAAARWTITSATILLLSSILGLVYSSIYFDGFDINPMTYIENIQDFPQLAYSSGAGYIVFLFVLIGNACFAVRSTFKTVENGQNPNTQDVIDSLRNVRLVRITSVLGINTLIFVSILISDYNVFSTRHKVSLLQTGTELICARVLGGTSRHAFVSELSEEACTAERPRSHFDHEGSRVIPKSIISCIGDNCSLPAKRLIYSRADLISGYGLFYNQGFHNGALTKRNTAAEDPLYGVVPFAQTFLKCEPIKDYYSSRTFRVNQPRPSWRSSTKVQQQGLTWNATIDDPVNRTGDAQKLGEEKILEEIGRINAWILGVDQKITEYHQLYVVGFASSEAANIYNLALSERRAEWYKEHVLEYKNGALLNSRLASMTIKTTGMGETVRLRNSDQEFAESDSSNRYAALIACLPK